MDSLPAQVRADVSASFLQRMGRASKANQNAAGDAFSMETFLSNWADISPEAKKQLFSNARFGTDYVQNVNKLARMADSIRSGSKVFANPPGTAKQTALGVTLGGTGLIAGQNVLQGNLGQAAITVASTLALAGANNLLARMMTNPRRFAGWPGTPSGIAAILLARSTHCCRSAGKRTTMSWLSWLSA